MLEKLAYLLAEGKFNTREELYAQIFNDEDLGKLGVSYDVNNWKYGKRDRKRNPTYESNQTMNGRFRYNKSNGDMNLEIANKTLATIFSNNTAKSNNNIRPLKLDESISEEYNRFFSPDGKMKLFN